MYIVSSDDAQWCKEKFRSFNNNKKKKRNIFYTEDFSAEREAKKLPGPQTDMAIAASCNHTIYDYGTFGFWGAYLAGGHAIFARHRSLDKAVENIEAAQLENWEVIEAFE